MELIMFFDYISHDRLHKSCAKKLTAKGSGS